MALRIVYIDDEIDVCRMVEDSFEGDKYVVATFTDVEKGLKDIESNKPDIVFLDYRMPKTSGDQVAKRIAADIPKVLITGEVFVKTESKFIRVFSKPFDFTELHRFIEDFASGNVSGANR